MQMSLKVSFSFGFAAQLHLGMLIIASVDPIKSASAQLPTMIE